MFRRRFLRKVPLFCKKRLSGLVDIACADGQDDIARLRILAQIGRHALQARTVDRAGDLRGQLLRADTDGVLFTRGVNIGQNDLVGRAQLGNSAFVREYVCGWNAQITRR